MIVLQVLKVINYFSQLKKETQFEEEEICGL